MNCHIAQRLTWIFIGLLFLYSSSPKALEEVIYPQPSSALDIRNNDLIAIAQAAQEATTLQNGDYELKPSQDIMDKKRYFLELFKGEKITLAWTSAKQKHAKRFQAIWIPLRKEILGYRIFLIRRTDQDKFTEIQTLSDLSHLTVGQKSTWGGCKIFFV